MQETYARVMSRPRLLRREDDLGYLLRTLRNVFIDSRRAQARRPVGVALPADEALADARGARDPERVMEATTVYDAIAALPDDFRAVIVAVDLVGLSYREAAAVLGTKEGTIMSRLYRARERVVAAVG